MNLASHFRLKGKLRVFLLLTVFAFGAFFLIGAQSPGVDAELISIGLDGQAGGGDFYVGSEIRKGAVSADGRYVVFSSLAKNLTEHDVSGWHVYLRDRDTDTTTLITNTGDTGTIYGSTSEGSAVISADGRFVAFQSTRSGLVAIDNNGASDIFVYDRLNQSLELASVATDGSLSTGCSCGWPDYCNGCEYHWVNTSPSISADGRYVAFTSFSYNFAQGDLPDTPDVFVRDRQEGTTTIISRAFDGNLGNGNSGSPAISADGSYVTFSSAANNLDVEDFNDFQDVFLWCRTTDSVRRVSISSDGEEGNLNSLEPDISADGNLITFTSGATNLAGQDTNGTTYDVLLRNEAEETTTLLTSGLSTGGRRSAISDDGKFVSFTTGRDEVQLHNLATGSRQLMSSWMQHSALDGTGSAIVMSGYDAMQAAIDTNGDKDVYLVALGGSEPPGETEVCNDGIDNDGDGLTDCQDTQDCSGDPNCSAPPAGPEICNDGIDNDGDGLIDCLDRRDCRLTPDCSTTGGGGGGGGTGGGGGGGGGKNR